MKNTIAVLLIIPLFGMTLFAQNWSEFLSPEIDFSNTGYSGIEKITGACRDASGNIYISGTFDQIITFGNETLISDEFTDGFVAKFDSDMNAVWAKTVTGDYFENITGIDCDASGNVFICGNYRNETYIGSYTLQAQTATHMFVAKLNSSGNWQWAEPFGSGRSDNAASLVVDNSGNCIITGYVADDANFGNISTTSNGSKDIFLAKIGTNGGWMWAKSIGGTGSDMAKHMTYSDGDCILTGYFNDTADLGSGTPVTSSGKYETFLLAYSDAGTYQYEAVCGSSSYDYGTYVESDGDKVYLTGTFYGDMTIGGFNLSSNGNYDFFCAVYTPGSGFDDAFSGGNDSGLDAGSGIYCAGNDIVFSVVFYDEITFEGTDYSGRGKDDILMITYDKSTGTISGAENWGSVGDDKASFSEVIGTGDIITFGSCTGKFYAGSKRADATDSEDIFYVSHSSPGSVTENSFIKSSSLNNTIKSVHVDRAGNRYVAGRFYGHLRFDNKLLISSGQCDGFIAKADIDGNWIWAKKCGGSGYDEVNDMAAKTDGNLAVCGTFYNKAYFDGTALDAIGFADAFVAEFDSATGDLKWVQGGGTAVFDDKATAIAVDSSSNIYVLGDFSSYTADKAYFPADTLTGLGLEDIFVAKIDSGGTWLWTAHAGGEGIDYGNDIAVTSEGTAYIAGKIDEAFDFGAHSGSTYGFDDACIAKIDSDGTWQGYVNAGSGNYNEEAQAVAVDSSGKVYSCGTFTNLAYFSGSSKFLFANAEKLAFFVTLDSDLNWLTFETIGSDNTSAHTAVTALAVNNEKQELFIAGKSNYDIEIGDSTYTNVGGFDLFFEKRDLNLDNIYSAYAGGLGDDIPYHICPSDEGETFVAGQYSHNTELGSNTYPLSNSYDNHGFVILNEYIPPPPPWEVPAISSNTAEVKIPESISPKINGHAPKKGDAIGIFYRQKGEYKCAGYSVYMRNDFNIVVRGDNPATTAVDGCPDGARYFYKTWDGALQQEFDTDANIDYGPRRFEKSAVTTIKHLPMQKFDTQTISMGRGWNMISSYIAPRNPLIKSLIDSAEYPDRIFLVKDTRGGVALPAYDIDNIDLYDERQGYLFYCTDSTEIRITGEEVDFSVESVPLKTGWNIFAMWNKSDTSVDTVLSSLPNGYFLMKNTRGAVNMPAYGIIQFPTLKTGQGYLIYMLEDGTIEY